MHQHTQTLADLEAEQTPDTGEILVYLAILVLAGSVGLWFVFSL